MTGVLFNQISANIRYCFIKGIVVPQKAITNTPYVVWVALHKDTGGVESGLCSCRAGLRGFCKHTIALLCYIAHQVESGANKACTSKPQEWHKPPRKGEKIHVPDFSKNFKISRVKGELDLGSISDKGDRSHFDPRSMKDRADTKITNFDLDRLATITGGNCALLMYAPRQQQPYIEDQVAGDTNVQMEVSIESTALAPTIEEAKEKALLKKESTNLFIENLAAPPHCFETVANETKGQSECDKWWTYRKGRITASKAHECANKINDDLSLKTNSHKSTLSAIMGYGGKVYAKPLEWGKKENQLPREHILIPSESQKSINPFNSLIQACTFTQQCHTLLELLMGSSVASAMDGECLKSKIHTPTD